MGTKIKPGIYDCYANACPDEPMFILLGRDKHAAGLVRLWALLRQKAGEDEAVIAEALQTADAMEEWLKKIGKSPREHDEAFEALYLEITEGMAEHPDGFDCPCACNLCLSYA